MNNLDERNEELNHKLAEVDLPTMVTALQLADKRRKFQVIVLGVSVALDLLLSVGLFVQIHKVNELAGKAESNTAAIIARCEVTNDSRTKNKRLWDYILKLPQNPADNPTQQKTRDEFVALVNDTFKLSDCNKLAEN